ncbi:hypothetical protein GCM10008170_29600 [Methylopila capsulata]|uniref:Uncharacterized protein n=1 Tax=Methylopila capsulata TaxID=61654 RepID=A0A9W6IUR4_9HYPH|nr:hypothetical protein GCM10008170_29600 [Methylopila capsulata]
MFHATAAAKAVRMTAWIFTRATFAGAIRAGVRLSMDGRDMATSSRRDDVSHLLRGGPPLGSSEMLENRRRPPGDERTLPDPH